MTDWRRSRGIAALAVGMFLTVQLAIPINRVASGAPERFGWQMFSKARDPIELSIEKPTGFETVDLEEVLARVRLDMDLEALVPSFLCDTDTSIVAVIWNGERLRC